MAEPACCGERAVRDAACDETPHRGVATVIARTESKGSVRTMSVFLNMVFWLLTGTGSLSSRGKWLFSHEQGKRVKTISIVQATVPHRLGERGVDRLLRRRWQDGPPPKAQMIGGKAAIFLPAR